MRKNMHHQDTKTRRNFYLGIALCFCAFVVDSRAPTMSIPAFNAGEWSPKLEGRQNVQKYYAAARVMENLIPLSQGPVRKRSGTYYIGAAGGENRVIPFEHSTGAARVLEFGDRTMRVFK